MDGLLGGFATQVGAREREKCMLAGEKKSGEEESRRDDKDEKGVGRLYGQG